jgi:hypothetical protein
MGECVICCAPTEKRRSFCKSCGIAFDRDVTEADVTEQECIEIVCAIARGAAYERGRAEGYAACMAHVAETAEKIAHAAGGGYDTNIAVATLRRFVGALEASRVGAAQKKGGAT